MLDTIWTHLWGNKETAPFDVWSIQHLAVGMSIGTLIRKINIKYVHAILKIKKDSAWSHWLDVIVILCIAFLWELSEYLMEIGLFGARVKYWFQGVEFHLNRFIFDPLIILLGYYISIRLPALVWPARFYVIIWLSLHIFIFPHTMYLHKIG